MDTTTTQNQGSLPLFISAMSKIICCLAVLGMLAFFSARDRGWFHSDTKKSLPTGHVLIQTDEETGLRIVPIGAVKFVVTGGKTKSIDRDAVEKLYEAYHHLEWNKDLGHIVATVGSVSVLLSQNGEVITPKYWEFYKDKDGLIHGTINGRDELVKM